MLNPQYLIAKMTPLMTKINRQLTTALLASVGLFPTAMYGEAASSPLNVLFIAVDDLRPELGSYGAEPIKTPNIDRLADQGLLFQRAYCQQAICMASRASLMSGYRPDKGQMYLNGPLFEHVPDALTINQHFQNNGYETVGIGKIYHHTSDNDTGWNKVVFRPKGAWVGRGYVDPESIRIVEAYKNDPRVGNRRGIGPAFESPDVPDNAYKDGVVADMAIAELNRLQGKPFFLGVGFTKPHLPFSAPKKYWDLYPEESIQLAGNPFFPEGAPAQARTNWGELRGYYGMPQKGPMPDDLALKLIHGYYASVSYIDVQIGKVLDELERLGLADNTVIVLWGDHGWKLGDHGMWAKHTNYEVDIRVPLIVSAPGMSAKGTTTKALTELVDLYPTLSELCGLPLPAHLEGKSMVPLLDNPDLPWKSAVFSQFPRGRVMGYSMRTDRYHYIEWREIESGNIKARELYDHQEDPRENRNLAGDPDKQDLIAQLTAQFGEKSIP